MPTVDVARGRINYRVAGPADSGRPPVVFIHGLLVNGELWTGVGEALGAHGIRCYAPDLPLGAHPIPLEAGADLSPRGVARLIIAFLEALDLSDVTLVGNDTGGALCQFLIDTDHSRIGRLVLTNCDAFDKFPPPPFGLLVKAGRRPELIRAMMATMRPTRVRHSVLGYGPLVSKPLDAALTRRWITPALTDAGVRSDAARFMRSIRPDELLDVSTRLEQFTKPVLLVLGCCRSILQAGLRTPARRCLPRRTARRGPGRTHLRPARRPAPRGQRDPHRVLRPVLMSRPGTTSRRWQPGPRQCNHDGWHVFGRPDADRGGTRWP